MSKGFSKDVVAAKLGISRDTLYEWAKTHDDFSDSIKRGEAKSLYFWEKIGMDGMLGKIKGFNATVWIFVMKNRFHYRDNPPQIDKNEDEQTSEEATEESLTDIVARYGKELLILDKINQASN